MEHIPSSASPRAAPSAGWSNLALPNGQATTPLVLVWINRRLVAAVLGIAAVLCVVKLVAFMPYQSDGVLQFGGRIPYSTLLPSDANGQGISLENYKIYSAVFLNPHTLTHYMELVPPKNIDAKNLLKKFETSRDTLVAPIYSVTKKDMKDIPDSRRDSSPLVVALDINFQDKTPDLAAEDVKYLGDYVSDVIIRTVYEQNAAFKLTEANTKVTAIDNNLINIQTQLAMNEMESKDLQEVILKYPELKGRGMVDRGITVSEDTARLLLPTAQLMKLDLQAVDLRDQARKGVRERKELGFFIQYYRQLDTLMVKSATGHRILQGLHATRDVAFTGMDLNDEQVREVFNVISIEDARAQTEYSDKTRFVVGPTIPTAPAQHRSRVAFAFLLWGLISGIVLALARGWWNAHRSDFAEGLPL